MALSGFPRVQDISLDEEVVWTQFRTYWDSGNYTAALALVKDIDWDAHPEFLNASILNALTETVEYLEEDRDPTYKGDKIKTVGSLPEEADFGEVFFLLGDTPSNTFQETVTTDDGLTYTIKGVNNQWLITKV